MKKYSSFQIKSAIDYWQFILNENQSTLLTRFAKEFGCNRVFSRNLKFSFDETTDFKAFDILNQELFEDKLGQIPFFYADTNEEMQTELSKFSYTLDDTYYAAYVAFLDEKILPSDSLFPMFKKERLYVNCGFGNMTFAFAMNTLCHEMIHQYDFHFGDIAKKKFYEPNVDDHSTIVFQKYMKLANSKGMNVMTSGTGKSFKRMNKMAADVFLMNENEDKKWLDLIARLKNGEKIPGFGYVDGSLVIIPK